MATKRKSLSKKTRFEVFKRDGFKCQYCGATSPEAILVVDHIDPISKDGADDMMNYITACQPCNAGKSDRKLDDSTTLQKQKAQLAELNERREQLEMMLQWRNGMQDISESQLKAAHSAWKKVVPGYGLSELGLNNLRKIIKKHGLASVLDAFDVVSLTYIKKNAKGVVDPQSIEIAWEKVPGVIHINGISEDQKELHYIKGILRNRLNYIPPDIIRQLTNAADDGLPIEDMKYEAKLAKTWTGYRQWLSYASGV